MILATVVSIGVVGISLLKTEKQEEAEAAEAAETTGEITVLHVDEPSMIADISRTELDKIIKDEQKVEVSAKEAVVLAQTKYDMTGKFIATEDAVNIRTTASEDGNIVGRLYKGGSGEVLEAGKEWTKIKSGDVTGYVATQYIVTDLAASEKVEELRGAIATATAQNVCIRAEGDGEADILYLAAQGEKFIVNKDRNVAGWYGVRLDDGTYGYISTEFATIEDAFSTAVSVDRIDSVKAAKEEIADKVLAGKEEAGKEEEEKAEESEETQSESDEKTAEVKEEKQPEKQEEKKEEKTEEKKIEETTEKQESEEVKEEKKEEEKEEQQEEPVEAEASDLYLLAAIVYCEAGAEPYDGQLAVANVVLNRLRTGKWGSTLESVIYAPYQFTGCQMSSFKTALKTGGTSSCLKAAQEALNGNNNVPGYLYFRPYKNVALDKLNDYQIIGTHVYYRN